MLSRLLSNLNALLRRRGFEAGMDDELRFHLEKRIEDLIRSGLSRTEAQRRAALEFGGLEQYKERCREARGLRLFDELRFTGWFRLQLRGGRRRWGFGWRSALEARISFGRS